MASLPGLITQRSRGTNTFPRKFKRNLGGAYAHLHLCDSYRDTLCHSYRGVLEEHLRRTRRLKIGPGYGHHRYYNRYEGLYNGHESGPCRELRAAHKEEPAGC